MPSHKAAIGPLQKLFSKGELRLDCSCWTLAFLPLCLEPKNGHQPVDFSSESQRWCRRTSSDITKPRGSGPPLPRPIRMLLPHRWRD